MEGAFNVGGLLHRPIVDRQQEVTWKESFNGGGSIGGDLGRHDTLWTLCPQNAVLHFIERCAGNDVGDAEAQQRRHDDHRQDRGAPEDCCA
jgi:hypothetical protein